MYKELSVDFHLLRIYQQSYFKKHGKGALTFIADIVTSE